jgi:hypothetical protein
MKPYLHEKHFGFVALDKIEKASKKGSVFCK